MSLIETNDLFGDRLDLSIAEDFHRISNSQFVLQWMDDWEMTLEQVKNLLTYFMRGYEVKDPEKAPYIFGIWHKETKRFIGICGFGPKDELGGEAEIAYFLDEQYANKGYMSQFVKKAIGFYFDMTNKPYISAMVDEKNLPSKKLLDKMGFVFHVVHDPSGCLKSHYRLSRKSFSL